MPIGHRGQAKSLSVGFLLPLRILRKLRKLRNIFGHDLSTESDMITDRTSRERERERDREMWME